MLIHPQFNPIAISLGPIQIYWYGLMYFFAFLAFIYLGKNYIYFSHFFRFNKGGWKKLTENFVNLFLNIDKKFCSENFDKTLIHSPSFEHMSNSQKYFEIIYIFSFRQKTK